MKRCGGNRDRHRALVAGLTLTGALLIALCVAALDPLPAPAAETTLSDGFDSAATPVVVDALTATESGSECPDGTDATTGTIAEAAQPGATPVALADETNPVAGGDASCVIGVIEDQVSDDAQTMPEPDADAGLAPIADAADASPVQKESGPLPSHDPFFVGFPTESPGETATVDPFVAGLPSTESPQVALPSGSNDEPPISNDDQENVPATDPTLEGLPETVIPGDPMLSGVAVTSEIALQVDVVTVDGDIIPGGSVSYLFRIANPGLLASTFRLVATADLPGWTAVVTEPESGEVITEPLILGAAEEIEVVVVVTASQEASIGDQVTTSLIATIQQ